MFGFLFVPGFLICSFSTGVKNFLTLDMISMKRSDTSKYSNQRWEQNFNGSLLLPVNFAKSFRLAGESLNKLYDALRALLTGNSDYLSLSLYAPCTICRPQLPISILLAPESRAIVSEYNLRNFQLTLGPSIEIWSSCSCDLLTREAAAAKGLST